MSLHPIEVVENIESLLKAAEGNNGAEVLSTLKALRNLCARSPYHQEVIVTHEKLNAFLHTLLFENVNASFNAVCNEKSQALAWQLLANSIVNNSITQNIVWAVHGDYIMNSCGRSPLDPNTEIQLMILYNIFNSKLGFFADEQALHKIVQIWQSMIAEKYDANMEFLHFFFEHFIVKEGRTTMRCYVKLQPEERIAFLDYLASYLRHDSPNGPVHALLLQYISKEFKVKSDYILRQSTHQVDQMYPREAYALLRVIACGTGCENYAPIYASDYSLFINISSLLRCLVATSKEAERNIFTPMTKLEEVAPTSNISHDYQKEISYELKTLLVRSVANLLYKNRINKNYCLDTQLLPALFECTNMDARNPLIKEWSILAIRNACIDCPEIQKVIANLTKQGDARNDLVSELNMQLGSLRIQPSKE